MKQTKQLSWTARYARKMLSTKNGNTIGTIKFAASLFLVGSILIIPFVFTFEKPIYLVLSAVWFMASIGLYQRSGFMELIQKEYTKK